MALPPVGVLYIPEVSAAGCCAPVVTSKPCSAKVILQWFALAGGPRVGTQLDVQPLPYVASGGPVKVSGTAAPSLIQEPPLLHSTLIPLPPLLGFETTPLKPQRNTK